MAAYACLAVWSKSCLWWPLIEACTVQNRAFLIFFDKILMNSNPRFLPGHVAFSLLMWGTASAQTLPNAGDVLRQVQGPVAPLAQALPVLPRLGSATLEAPMAALPNGPKLEVKHIEVLGQRVIDAATLAALVADGVGQSLNLSELEALAQRITRYYRAQGFFVARAYIPAQEIDNGRLRIRVVEGNYGEFHLQNRSLVRDDIVQAMLDDVKGADIVSLDTLERAMLIINDTPGVQVTRADVMPGTRVGTSDFAVDTQATAARSGYVLWDNHGSVYTGQNRVSFNADFNSVTGRGDKLSISGLVTESGGLLNGRVAYSKPLAPNGLRGETSLSTTRYALGDTYDKLNAHGTAKTVDATLTYPVRRIRAQTLEVSLNVAAKDLLDQVDATQTRTAKTSQMLTLAAALRDESTVLGLAGMTRLTASLTWGTLDIQDAAALALDAAGPNTQGRFQKINLGLSRVSVLPYALSLSTSLNVQQSLQHKNLDGSERMSVTGTSAVMAYPSGELNGSHAVLARVELSRPLPVWRAWQSSASVFSDWGQARAAHTLMAENTRSLSDVGLAWTAQQGAAMLKFSWVRRLASEAPSSEPLARNKLWAQAGWVF